MIAMNRSNLIIIFSLIAICVISFRTFEIRVKSEFDELKSELRRLEKSMEEMEERQKSWHTKSVRFISTKFERF